MGQKQSYRLGEGNTRTMAADGEVAYNTEDDVFASVQVRPVDSEGNLVPAPTPPRQSPPKPAEVTPVPLPAEVTPVPQKVDVLERIEPMPTTPIKIAPPEESPQFETSEITVAVIPATPANDETERISEQVEAMHIVNEGESDKIQEEVVEKENVELDHYPEDRGDGEDLATMRLTRELELSMTPFEAVESHSPKDNQHEETLEQYIVMDRSSCTDSTGHEHEVDLPCTTPLSTTMQSCDHTVLEDTVFEHSSTATAIALESDVPQGQNAVYGQLIAESNSEQHTQISETKEAMYLQQGIKELFSPSESITEQHVQISETKEEIYSHSARSDDSIVPEGTELTLPSEEVHMTAKVPTLPEIPLESTVHARS